MGVWELIKPSCSVLLPSIVRLFYYARSWDMLGCGMFFPQLTTWSAMSWRLLLAFSCGMPLGLQGGTVAPQPAREEEKSLEFLQARFREIRQELGRLAFENIEEGLGSVDEGRMRQMLSCGIILTHGDKIGMARMVFFM